MAEWDAASDSSWRRGGKKEEGSAEMLQQYAQDMFQAETVKSAYYEVCWFQSKRPVNEWTHQFFVTLIVSLSLHIVHIVQIRKNSPKKIFHCFTFSEHPSGKALSLCCSAPHVETDEIPVSRVTLLSAEPKVSLNCKNTKPLWICHLPSLYLELQAALFSGSSAMAPSCARPGFPFCSLSLWKKKN